MPVQAYKKETLGQEALLKEREEAMLAARKRKFGAHGACLPASLPFSFLTCVLCFSCLPESHSSAVPVPLCLVPHWADL